MHRPVRRFDITHRPFNADAMRRLILLADTWYWTFLAAQAAGPIHSAGEAPLSASLLISWKCSQDLIVFCGAGCVLS
jgi:hypothetical protein